MKIYFGGVRVSQNDEHYDVEGAFRVRGENYWNYVEYGTNPGGLDEVAICDGCDRYIPIHIDHLDELIQALQRVQELHESQQNGTRDQELALSEHEETTGW